MGNYGLKFPLHYNKASGYEQFDNIVEYIRFCIKLICLTAPGEKLNDFSYGIDLRSSLFKNKSDTSLLTTGARIKEQIEKYLPSVVVRDVRVADLESEHENAFYVKIVYFIKDVEIEDDFDLHIQGGI